LFSKGNVIIDASNVNLSSIELVIDKDLSISLSNIEFYYSTIVSKGCINCTKVNFTIDLTNVTLTNDKLFLMNSTIGCLNIIDSTFNFINAPKCTTLTSETTPTSLFILFSNSEACNPTNPQKALPIWEITLITIGAVVGAGLIFILIVMVIPDLRNRFFPNKKVRYDLKRRTKELEEKLNN